MLRAIAFVALLSVAGVALAQSPKEAAVDEAARVDAAARAFRIQLYMTHQHDRDAYLRHRDAGEQAWKAWKRAGSPEPETMVQWFRDARYSVVQGGGLPTAPAFAEGLADTTKRAMPVSNRGMPRPTHALTPEERSPEAAPQMESVLAVESATQANPSSDSVAKTESTPRAPGSDPVSAIGRAFWRAMTASEDANDAVGPIVDVDTLPTPKVEVGESAATDDSAATQDDEETEDDEDEMASESDDEEEDEDEA